MNWIERMYELKGKDLYSQNGEGLYLEYIYEHLNLTRKNIIDIGGGDGIYLSNSRHLKNIGFYRDVIDRENGIDLNLENAHQHIIGLPEILSIDIDGNDYWILKDLFDNGFFPPVVIAEFNASYTDSRTIEYNPEHVWAGDSYYGFTFDAGVKLAEKHGYKVIFQIADMNMIMVRADLIEGLTIPPVTFKQNNYFKLSEKTNWVWI